MKQYHDLLADILENGEARDDRTGVGTLSVFGRQLRFNLQEGFPAITTKKLAWRAVVGELLWFIEGSSDERRLAEITHGTRDGAVTIWSPNAHAPYWKPKAKFDGDLGRVYGVQWRHWQTPVFHKQETYRDEFGNQYNRQGVLHVKETDQIRNLIDGIKNDPYSRRHVVISYNPGEIEQMALPPCHALCQFYVGKNNKLSCQVYIRSNDIFLGNPFNVASYALLTHMIAHVCGLNVGDLVISIGDAHIYMDHLDQVKEQLTRESFPLPKLWLNPEIKNIDHFKMTDINLLDYKCHPPLKAPMAV